jgi:hypothetical protein
MDLTEAENDCAGEDQQEFNQPPTDWFEEASDSEALWERECDLW